MWATLRLATGEELWESLTPLSEIGRGWDQRERPIEDSRQPRRGRRSLGMEPRPHELVAQGRYRVATLRSVDSVVAR